MEFSSATVPATLTAIIAGAVSLLGLVLAKEQKISDLRQAWIDSIREDIAKIISISNELSSSPPVNLTDSQNSDRTKRMLEIVDEINIRTYRTKMKLNTKESEAQNVDAAIDELKRVAEGGYPPDDSSLDVAEDNLVVASQKMFKKEWERVKRGEPNYRIARYVASTLLFISTILFFLSFFNVGSETRESQSPLASVCISNPEVSIAVTGAPIEPDAATAQTPSGTISDATKSGRRKPASTSMTDSGRAPTPPAPPALSATSTAHTPGTSC